MSEENQGSYDLFISYRSAKSGRHATALRRALYAFDKRHANVGLRIFLDRISLKNGPLSKHIEDGLRRSRCLVVLIDSTTRESPWVDTEITTWLKNGGSAEKLFLIKTDQVDLAWDKEKKNFRSPEQLPPALCGVFKDEQKFTDFLVPPRRVKDIDLVPLYSAITEQDPDGLEVDEKQYRARQRARSRLFVAVLCTLLVGAIIMAIIAAQNAIRANEASRQARADALAAEALLTLPVSPERAMAMGIQAGKLNDSASIRSALVEIAAGTGRLAGTMSLTKETDATSLTSLSFDPDGRYLTAWGPGTTEGRTVVATWLNISGDLTRSFEIEGNIQTLIEIPGQSYLACTDTKAVEIDWHTHDITALAEGKDLHCTSDVTASGMAMMSVIEGEDPGYGKLHVRTMEGKRYEIKGKPTPAPPTSLYRFVRLEGEVEDMEQSRVVVVGPGGVSQEVEVPGNLVNEDPTALTFKLNDGTYAALSVKDEKPVLTSLSVPQDAESVTSWAEYNGELRWFWATSGGAVGTSLTSTTVTLTAGKGVVSVHHFGGAGALVISNQTFSEVAVDTDGVLSITEIKRLAPDTWQEVKTCGGSSLAIGDEHVFHASVAGTVRVSSRIGKTELVGCKLVELGSPVMVDHKTVITQGVVSPGRMAISTSESFESFVTGRTDGTISRYSLGDPAISWRSKYESEFLVSRDGFSQLRNPALGPLEVSVDGVSHEIREKDGGRWLLPRPDGLGGIFMDGNKWAVKLGNAPSKFYDTTSADYASYRPGAGFENDRSAAEEQRLVCDMPSYVIEIRPVDCITDETVEKGPKILDYRIGPSLGRIVTHDAGRIGVTTWNVGDPDARPVTRYVDLPGPAPDAAAVSLDGSRVVVVSANGSEAQEYKLESGKWVSSGEGYSLGYGGASFVSYSPDSSLLLTATSDGRFEVFDVSSRRHLVSGAPFEERAEKPAFQYMSVMERDGYLVATFSSREALASLTIPTSTDVLVNLLCGVRKTEECGS